MGGVKEPTDGFRVPAGDVVLDNDNLQPSPPPPPQAAASASLFFIPSTVAVAALDCGVAPQQQSPPRTRRLTAAATVVVQTGSRGRGARQSRRFEAYTMEKYRRGECRVSMWLTGPG